MSPVCKFIELALVLENLTVVVFIPVNMLQIIIDLGLELNIVCAIPMTQKVKNY